MEEYEVVNTKSDKIVLDIGLKDEDEILDIPYYVKKKEKKNYMKQVLDTYRRLRRKDGQNKKN